MVEALGDAADKAQRVAAELTAQEAKKGPIAVFRRRNGATAFIVGRFLSSQEAMDPHRAASGSHPPMARRSPCAGHHRSLTHRKMQDSPPDPPPPSTSSIDSRPSSSTTSSSSSSSFIGSPSAGHHQKMQDPPPVLSLNSHDLFDFELFLLIQPVIVEDTARLPLPPSLAPRGGGGEAISPSSSTKQNDS